ncbi:hypothetical protein ABIC03_007793 [Bradyrhizobium sp. RT6a]
MLSREHFLPEQSPDLKLRWRTHILAFGAEYFADIDDMFDSPPPGGHHRHELAEHDGFVGATGNEEDRLAGRLPDAREFALKASRPASESLICPGLNRPSLTSQSIHTCISPSEITPALEVTPVLFQYLMDEASSLRLRSATILSNCIRTSARGAVYAHSTARETPSASLRAALGWSLMFLAQDIPPR